MSLTGVLLATLLAGGVVLIGWRAWRRYQHFKVLRRLPSPAGVPVLGNLPQLLRAVRNKRFFLLLFTWSQRYGPVFVYWQGKPVVVLSNPALIETTIVQGMRSGQLARSAGIRRAWNDLRGPILIGEDGPQWQWRRKAWNPEFTPGSIAAHLPLIQEASGGLLAQIAQASPHDALALDPLFVEMTMRIMASLVLGLPLKNPAESPEGPALDVGRAHEAMAVLGYRFLRLATGEQPWMKFVPNQASRDYWAARRYLDDLLAPRVALALQFRDGVRSPGTGVSELFSRSMLVRMAMKEPRYSQESLLAETVEFLIAGTDTTAHTLSFAMGCLALHPEVGARARQSVDQAWRSHGGLNAESIGELAYLRGVIKETLRLFSVASGSSAMEVVKPDTVLEGIGPVPVGTSLMWSMLAAGRDPDAYAQPLEFRPERWCQQGADRLPPPMVDFGSGAHRCIGEHLAMLEATVVLAELLHAYDWELVNGAASLDNQEQDLLIYPADGMPVRFRQRSPQSRCL